MEPVSEFELMADFEAKIGSALADLCKSGLFDPEEALILLDTYKNHFAILISVFCKQRHSDENENLKSAEIHAESNTSRPSMPLWENDELKEKLGDIFTDVMATYESE